MAARELTVVVVMGGEVYGPGYLNPPPDDVAKGITNPACWGEEKSDTDDASPQHDPADEPAAPVQSGPAVPTEPAPVAPVPAPADVPAPPRSGAGSGVAAWRVFADAKGVTYPAAAGRDDIIEACEKAKVI